MVGSNGNAEKRIGKLEVVVGRHDEQLEEFRRGQDRQNGSIEKMERNLSKITSDISEIKQEMIRSAHGKPSWALTVFISLLSTITASLAVYLIML